MTPIERMARAICRAEHILLFLEGPWRPGELDAKVDQHWQLHVPAARAALAAIEEPSKEMIQTGNKTTSCGGSCINRAGHRTWTAMIRAALEQGP